MIIYKNFITTLATFTWNHTYIYARVRYEMSFLLIYLQDRTIKHICHTFLCTGTYSLYTVKVSRIYFIDCSMRKRMNKINVTIPHLEHILQHCYDSCVLVLMYIISVCNRSFCSCNWSWFNAIPKVLNSMEPGNNWCSYSCTCCCCWCCCCSSSSSCCCSWLGCCRCWVCRSEGN